MHRDSLRAPCALGALIEISGLRAQGSGLGALRAPMWRGQTIEQHTERALHCGWRPYTFLASLHRLAWLELT